MAHQESRTAVGLTFRETMAGGFTLGETGYEAGDKQGKAAGKILAVHCTIEIADLDLFLADRTVTGNLSGTVDLVPLGVGLPATRGVFNLFSSSDDPKTRLMVYEMAFAHCGEEYYLAGKKEVRDDFGVDLWSDTTTLYTRLHRGTDAAGPMAGAGILRLGPAELLKLLSTLRATNAASTVEEGAAISRFGQFFLGQLWNSYAGMVARQRA